jgi:hypothetical protein
LQTLSEKSKNLFQNFEKLQEERQKLQKLHEDLACVLRKDNRRVKLLLLQKEEQKNTQKGRNCQC